MADPSANDPQEPELDSALVTLRGLLTAGETLEAWAVQHRLYALTHRRACVAATSGRFHLAQSALARRLRFSRHPLAGSQGNAHQCRHPCRRPHPGRAEQLGPQHRLRGQSRLDLHGLRKEQAQAMYRICQQHDQVWREKRRIRELEELRAKSGGVQIGGAQNSYSAADAAGAEVGAGAAPASGARNARCQTHHRLRIRVIKAKIVSGL